MIKKIGTRLFFLSLLSILLSMPFCTLKVAADAPDATIVKRARQDDFSNLRLCPGGEVFGVRMFMPGVMIINIDEVSCNNKKVNPAKEGGLALKDLITHINGQEIRHVADVTNAIENSQGKTLHFTINRNGQTLTLPITPVFSESEGKYCIGIWIRDRTAGIGTITFINPETGAFGGLGHGICDPDTGEVIPFSRGIVTDVAIQGVTKGMTGSPGELRGSLGLRKRGILSTNNHAGVFGILNEIPPSWKEKTLPLAHSSEVKVGKAEICCTLKDQETKHYSIEITKIHSTKRETKCFSIRVTDPELLETTGGIVQGMSGSPIIQNGKIVGAVTHVMVNDPTRGYGIFIENMLNAAQIPMAIES